MLHLVILAAGAGKRMYSDLPKVLHLLGGRPLLAHVLAAAQGVNPETIHIVYGHGGQQVRDAFATAPVRWVEQAQQLGTGHAVAQALPAIPDDATVMVLYGDVPLLQAQTLRALLHLIKHPHQLALLTVKLRTPAGYGRIVRDDLGQVLCIVEEKDATPAERAISEVNTGILAAPASALKSWVARLSNTNAQGEYYLTDIIALAKSEDYEINTLIAPDHQEVTGVNDRLQLAELERTYQSRQARALLRKGVGLADPDRLDIRGELETGYDVFLDINVICSGRVVLGDGVRVGAGCILHNVVLGPGVEVLPYSALDGVEAGAGCRIGPYARLRPGTVLAAQVHIGNFVELKNSQVDNSSKINHLSYIGDTTVGAQVNIGAGTITCNYDGVHKHHTIIEDRAFIGSNTQLVAPVTVGAGATIGAGSTLTHDAPAEQLTLARARQVTLPHWRRPSKRGD